MPMAIRPSIFGSARILGANFRSFTSDSSIGDRGTEAIAHICHLRFLPRMVSESSSRFASWCNGSTSDSGSLCHGSNPCEAAIRRALCLLMAGHSTQTERDVRPNKRVECPDKPRARRTGPNGLFLPFGKVIKRFDSERIDRLIWKIMRSLNFHQHPRFGPRIGKSLGRLIIHVRTFSHLNISNTSRKYPTTHPHPNILWSLVHSFCP